MPYLCGFWRFANAYYSKQTKGETDEDNKANISLDGKERKGACSTGGRTG